MTRDTPATLRIGTLAGSLRKSSHARLLAACLPALAPVGMAISPLPDIGALPHFDQDEMDRGVPEPVAALAEAVAALDGVVIVSPEYNWSIPGAVKNALDWLSRLEAPPLRDKPVVIFTVSPGLLGGARAHPPIRNVLHALDCRILARPEVQVGQVAAKLDPDGVRVRDEATAHFLAERLAAFGAFASERAVPSS